MGNWGFNVGILPPNVLKPSHDLYKNEIVMYRHKTVKHPATFIVVGVFNNLIFKDGKKCAYSGVNLSGLF